MATVFLQAIEMLGAGEEGGQLVGYVVWGQGAVGEGCQSFAGVRGGSGWLPTGCPGQLGDLQWEEEYLVVLGSVKGWRIALRLTLWMKWWTEPWAWVEVLAAWVAVGEDDSVPV